MLIFILGALILWLGLGYIAAAREFAYFQNKFPLIAKAKKNRDKRDSYLLFFGGISAFISMFTTSFIWKNHGFDWLWPIR